METVQYSLNYIKATEMKNYSESQVQAFSRSKQIDFV
jgi:hypothetical protein